MGWLWSIFSREIQYTFVLMDVQLIKLTLSHSGQNICNVKCVPEFRDITSHHPVPPTTFYVKGGHQYCHIKTIYSFIKWDQKQHSKLQPSSISCSVRSLPCPAYLSHNAWICLLFRQKVPLSRFHLNFVNWIKIIQIAEERSKLRFRRLPADYFSCISSYYGGS